MAETLLQQGQIDGLVSALNGKANWHIGQIVPSTLPITDAGLHLLDGALISGSGTYAAFVDYIGDLYDNTPSSGYQYNVNIVGSLANTDGVLSGFSNSNYAVIEEHFNPESNPWEFVFKINMGGTPTGNIGLGGILTNKSLNYYLPANSNNITVELSSNNSTFNIGSISCNGLLPNVDYWIKTEFTGTAYNLYVSTDGETYTLQGSITSSTPIYYNANILNFGVDYNYSSFGNFTIDLNESYINVNNNRWWTGANPSWVTDEAQWQTSVSTYGVCGKFVYDSVNNTVRLPKITGIIEGTTDAAALGDLVAAGLPNITGSITGAGDRTSFPGAAGAFYGEGSTGTGSSSSSTRGYMTVYLNASRSSSIYKDSFNKVQPQTIKTLYYICIATSAKTDIQADIDQIASDLNGKAETDLSNLNSAGNIYGSKLSMPSAVNEAITIGSSGANYTAPSNGWVYASGVQTSSGGWIALVSSSGIITRAQTSYSNVQHDIFMPVKKGDIFQFHWVNVGSKVLTFIYAEGSKTEAN